MWSVETCRRCHLAMSTMASTLQRHWPPSQVLDMHITVFFHCKARALHMLPTPSSYSSSRSVSVSLRTYHVVAILLSLTPPHFFTAPSSNSNNHMLQFSCSVMSDPLPPHGLQHNRPPCPSPTPGAYSNSCPWSRWCHPIISSSVIPFSSHLQSFPALESFPVSHFLASSGQSIGVSASTSVLPMNIQDWFPLWLTGWISLQSKRLSKVFSNTAVQKHQFFGTRLSLQSNSHIHTWLLEKP